MITFEYGLLMLGYNLVCLLIGLIIAYFIINRRK